MHLPNPDPTGRPSSAKSAAGGPSDPRPGSTSSHPAGTPEPSLSDLLRGGSSSARRSPNPADLAAHLASSAGTAAPDPPLSSDDAPTIITQPGKAFSPPVPPPPYILGETPSLAGRRLGHFELIEAIGAGGMAAVLKARDLDLGRIVALKILPPESAHDVENVTRFKQEARAAAKLDHENVARVYFCGEDQGLHFIAFEFVEGVTLRKLIDRRGPLPAGECVRYMLQVAAGLAHAADRGVVHRDIKPSNILVTPDGRAKIVDMGLARHLDAGAVNGGVTQSGITLGTFDYISPEQALDPREADVRSDIYSLGCAFYHALTGRPPVPEGTAAKKLHAHQHLDPLDPRELNPAIPDEVAAVLARMMAKDPARRYQTPAELIAHLKAVAEHLQLSLDAVASDATVQAVPADDRVLPRPPRLRLGWVAAGAAVTAAVVVIAVSAGGPDEAPAAPSWAGGADVLKPPLPPLPSEPATKAAAGTQAPGDDTIATADGLATALGRGKTPIHLARGEYDLSKLGKAVVFRGPQFDLTGAGSETVIRLAAPPVMRVDSPAPGTLTVRAGTVNVRGVRFEFASPTPADEEPEIGGEPRGLVLEDVGRVELWDCLFFPDERARQAGLVAIHVSPAAGEDRPRVHLERCLFAPGAVGVSVPRRATVDVADSGFGPHRAAILIRDTAPGTEPSTPVLLDRSSFLFTPASAVVRAEGEAKPDVRAGYCAFAPAAGATAEPRVPGMMSTPQFGAVVRVAGEKPDGVKLAAVPGQKNAYYAVDPVATEAKGYSFDDCKADMLPVDGTGWVRLDHRPWSLNGGTLPAFTGPDPYQAFRLALTGPGSDRRLFLPKLGLIGAQFHAENVRRAYPNVRLWPPLAPDEAEVKTRVWVPDGRREDLKPDEYNNLVNLLQDARPGDTILIRANGPVLVPQQAIESSRTGGAGDRADFHLTFKPDKGYAPVLVPKLNNKLEVSLFRVIEGRVRFEGLHFQAKPGPNQGSLAVVTLVAARGCEFHNCTFTLDEGEGQTTAVAAVADPAREMKMDGPPAARTPPRVALTGCLVRGKGRVVSVPASRPFALEMDQCITGLNGPVVYAKAGGRDPGTGTPAAVRLTRVTALLGGPLVELHGGKVGEMRASGLVPTTVTADGCLFAAVPGAGRPVIEVSGTEFDPKDPNAVLKWDRPNNDNHNRFANFEPTASPLVVQPGDDGGQVQMLDWDKWTSFVKEVLKPLGRVTFRDEPEGLRGLATLKPADVVVTGVMFPDLPDAAKDDAGADPAAVAAPPDEAKPPE